MSAHGLLHLFDALAPRGRVRVLVGALLLVTLLVGGYSANCEGLYEGWPFSGMRGLQRVGDFSLDARSPDMFANAQDFIIQFEVRTMACGEKTSELQWFQISLARLLDAAAPPTRDAFEAHTGEIPAALNATLRRVRYGDPVNNAWPEHLQPVFNDCIVRADDASIVSDCSGPRVEVSLPTFFSSRWTETPWWRLPMRILGLPLVLLFDLLTIPLNAAVVAMFLFPLYFSELTPYRRYMWHSGIVTAVAFDVVAFVLFFPMLSGGHRPLGRGGLAGQLSGSRYAILSGVIPFVVGVAVSRQTKQEFVGMGILCAIGCFRRDVAARAGRR
jgi:hypothetical protein